MCEKCLKILGQCRCMACNKTVTWDLCDECKAKVKEEFKKWQPNQE